MLTCNWQREREEEGRERETERANCIAIILYVVTGSLIEILSYFFLTAGRAQTRW